MKFQENMNVKRIAFFGLEAAALIVIFVVWRIEDSIIPHTKRGFICGDSSLSYPSGTTASIPSEWVNISVYAAPVAIWIIELSVEFVKEQSEWKRKFLTTSLRCLKWFIFYYGTFMLLMIFTTLLKNQVGGLRPVFLRICQPNLAVNCTTGQFITPNYKCTNPVATESSLTEIRRSFPSGHTTASVYITLFFMRYLQATFAKFRVTLSAVHLLCSVWMVLCSVSRITEHFHHVGDVIAGIIVALVFVFYSTQILCKGFRRTCEKAKDQLCL